MARSGVTVRVHVLVLTYIRKSKSLSQYFLAQTEYLEETVLRAEACSCAGRRGCSQPWDAAVLAGAAALSIGMLNHVRQDI